jgi:hypothetical protein
MTRILIVAALMGVVACSQEEQTPLPANETASVSSAPGAAQAVPALEGQWRIAAMDGKPISAASAMTASFQGGKVNISSGCLRRAWTYTQKKNVVSFAADPGRSANCGSPPSGEQETAYAALDGASIAIFSKNGGEASLSGTGGNLTLERR